MTTSPNVLLYAAMDGWRRQMVEHGHELLSNALNLARQVRQEIELIPDVEVLDDELLGVQSSRSFPIALARALARMKLTCWSDALRADGDRTPAAVRSGAGQGGAAKTQVGQAVWGRSASSWRP